MSNRQRRRRKVVGASFHGRAAEEPRRVVKASRRTYFKLYAPLVALTQIRTGGYWRAHGAKILAAALVISFAFTLYEIFASDLFYVPQLTLAGNHILPASDIEQAANIRGWNIFFINASEVQAAIENLPEVKVAQVDVNLPNEIQVQVTERIPRFVWQARGKTFWVDDDGIALKVRFKSPGLLTMNDLDGSVGKVGERVNAEAFNAAVNLRNLWPNGPRSFEWSKAHGLAVRDSHGWLVYFGSASQMPDKMTALNIVTAQLVKDRHAIAYIDVGSGLPYFQEIATKQ